MEQQVERIPFNYNNRQIRNKVMLSSVAQQGGLPTPVDMARNLPNAANMSAGRGVTAVPSTSSVRGASSTALITLSRKTSNQIKPKRPTPQKIIACLVCDKVFSTQKILLTHMTKHGAPKHWTFKCELCKVRYPSAQLLKTHKEIFHRSPPNVSPAKPQAPLAGQAFPIVDMRTPGIELKLLKLGVRHVLKLCPIGSQQESAFFGLPIVPLATANNQTFCSLGDIGVSTLLPLGNFQPL